MVDDLKAKERKNAKASQMGGVQHISRSGEKGRIASFWLVGESRLLYVLNKGKHADGLFLQSERESGRFPV